MKYSGVFVGVSLLLISLTLTGVLYQTGDVPTDETLTSVEIDEDGDAVFTLELRTRLDTEERSEAFENFESEVEQNPDALISDFRNSVLRIVEDARNQTEREMSATDFRVETSVEPLPVERGVVRYSFNWSGFAEVSEEESDEGSTEEGTRMVRAGDVLSGYILSEGDSLVFLYPEGYTPNSINPQPDINDTGEARWNGPRDFADNQPRLTIVEGDAQTGTGTPDGSESTEGEEEPTSDGSGGSPSSLPLYAYGIALVVLLSVGAVAYHTNNSTDEEETEPTAVDEPRNETNEIPQDLPDDERILAIVERAGGRMKQKRVVEETGWSEAKVSQVTSRLEDENKISKLRMGRENILEIQNEEGGDGENEDNEGERGSI